LPSRKVLLADSSALIALDRTDRITILKNHVTFVPPAVRREIVDDALAIRTDAPVYAEALASANRFRYYIERGHIRVLRIDYAKRGKTMDRTRKRLARLEGSREDQVPKADAEMAAGIAQLIHDGQEFDLLCDDETLVRVLQELFAGIHRLTSDELVGFERA
jgi:hypothetical protein